MKRILTDIAGIGLLLGALLFGWIPGPGGIPLVIAGLSLLAMNHEWAERWLRKVRSGGMKFVERLFTKNQLVPVGLDVAGIGLMAAAVVIITPYTPDVRHALAIVAGFVGLGIFLGNRRRLQRLVDYIRGK
jgi:hypothetical protein